MRVAPSIRPSYYNGVDSDVAVDSSEYTINYFKRGLRVQNKCTGKQVVRACSESMDLRLGNSGSGSGGPESI